jgi:hypothetical protein|tara:strand:- start:627 stop:800 length:174 start_codon:yes stop_codon:yes gene_type:complete
MSNPNNNQNALSLALEINRSLKKEIEDLKEELERLKYKEVRLSKEEYIAKIGELDGI